LRLAEGNAVQVYFQHRRKQRVEELYDDPEPWIDSPPYPMTDNGRFQTTIAGLDPELEYQYRAIAVHPKITVFSQEADIER